MKSTGRAAILSLTESQEGFAQSLTHTKESLQHRYFTDRHREDRTAAGATLQGVADSTGPKRKKKRENRQLTLFEWLEC